MREADVCRGQNPFGAHHCVGACLLADPWVTWAIATLEARPPQEPLEKTAKTKSKTKRKDEE